MTLQQAFRLAERIGAATTGCVELPRLAETVYAAVCARIPFSFACFATTDPTTGLPCWSSKTRPTGCGDEEFAAVEFGGPDVNTLAEIAHRTPPVGALWADTDGHPESCRRYREFLLPRFGFTDELRVVFRSRSATWGALALYREAGAEPFTRAEAAELGTLSETLAEAVQRCLFAPRPLPHPEAVPGSPGPAVVIVSADDSVTHLSAAARAAVEDLGGWDQGSLPTSVLAVVAVARTGTTGQTRVQTPSGRWLSLRGAPLAGPAGHEDIVVTFEPIGPAELSRLTFAAHGLTTREEEVAALVLQGLTTQSIAGALHLSPHTVQDHLKAIFAKLGVNSRRELVSHMVLG